MVRITLALLAMIALTSPASATDFAVPKQQITGTEKVDTGDLAILVPSPLVEKDPNLQSVSYDWKVLEPDFTERRIRVEPDGSVLFGTGSRPRTLKVFCSATYLYVVKAGAAVSEVATKTVFLSADVVVGGAAPPSPTPPAPPAFDPGKYNLAKFAFDAATAQVTSPTRAAEANALASAMLANVEQFGKAIVDPATAQARVTADNLATLARLGAAGRWDAWSAAIGKQLATFFQQGQLRSLDDYGQALTEIIAGLSEIK